MLDKSISRPVETQNTQEWKNIVANLANNQTSIGASFRLALDSNSYELFQECMEIYIKEKENDIYDVCNANYKEFIDSVQDIVKIKSDIRGLQSNLKSCNEQVQEMASKVLILAENVTTLQKNKTETENAIQRIEKTMKVVASAKIIDGHIKNDKLFHAIKTLESLKDDCSMFSNRRFEEKVQKWINNTSSAVSSQAKEIINSWIQKSLQISQSIGNEAMQKFIPEAKPTAVLKPSSSTVDSTAVAEVKPADAKLSSSNKAKETKTTKSSISARPKIEPSKSSTTSNTAESASVNARKTDASTVSSPSSNRANLELPSLRVLRLEAVEVRQKQQKKSEYKQLVLKTLSPLFRSLQVFMYLKQLENFQDFYDKTRIPLFDLSKVIGDDTSTMAFNKFFGRLPLISHRLVGMFALERILCEGTNGILLEQDKLESIFRRTMQQLTILIDRLLKSSPVTVDQFMSIRLHILNIATVLGNDFHSFDIECLMELLRMKWPDFANLCVSESKEIIQRLIAEDSFESAMIANKDEANMAIATYGYIPKDPDTATKTAESATTFPFTKSILLSIKCIRDMLEKLYAYSQSLRCHDWQNAARAHLLEMLTFLNQSINSVQLDHALEQQISFSIQIAVNTTTLVTACTKLDAILKTYAEQLGAEVYNMATAGAEFSRSFVFVVASGSIETSVNEFKSTTVRAQDIVCELMVRKIDSLLSSSLDLCPAKARNLPHTEITDLIDYLNVAFGCLSPLPDAVKTFVYTSSCTHITKELLSMLTSTRIKRINMGGLLDLRLSIDSLFTFGKRYDTRLNESFYPIDQTLKLLFSGELDKIMDPNFSSMEEYKFVQASDIITILEKYQENLTSSLQWNKDLIVVVLRKQKVDQILKQWKTSHRL